MPARHDPRLLLAAGVATALLAPAGTGYADDPRYYERRTAIRGFLDGPPQPAMVAADATLQAATMTANRDVPAGRVEDQALATPWTCTTSSCKTYQVTTYVAPGRAASTAITVQVNISGPLSVRFLAPSGRVLHEQTDLSDDPSRLDRPLHRTASVLVPPGTYRVVLVGNGGPIAYDGQIVWVALDDTPGECRRECADGPLATPGRAARLDARHDAAGLVARVDSALQPSDIATTAASDAGWIAYGATQDRATQRAVEDLAPTADRPCTAPDCVRYVFDLAPPRHGAKVGELWVVVRTDPTYLPAGVALRLRDAHGRLLRPSVSHYPRRGVTFTDTLAPGRYYLEISSNDGAGDFNGVALWSATTPATCRFDCP